jgi:GNAT superfamily N-acetyltransferase
LIREDNNVSALIRSIALGDVTAAVNVIIGGSTRPETERPDETAPYWAAVQETRSRRGEILVAELDDEVVGVVQVLIFQHLQHVGGWCGEIESVHVRADKRNRGIGGALLEAAEALAIERGCYRVQLTSNNVRQEAHRFYSEHGYVSSHQGFKKFFNTQ